MSVPLSLGIFAGGVLLLVLGGDLLVRGAVTLAERMGVKPLYVGLTIVAFGTSAPELALNLAAAAGDNTGLTFGNMVGSSLANVGWILGLLACVRPLKVQASLVRRELPVLLGAVLGVGVLMLAPPHTPEGERGLSRLDGVLMIAGFIGVLAWTLRSAAKRAPQDAELREELVEIATREPISSIHASLTQLLGGLVLLGIGGKLGEMGAVGVAQVMGLSQQLVGLTVVSFATTLPELAASIMAARRGQHDIALGNIIGSNLFNLLFILGSVAMLTHVALPPGGLAAVGALLGLTLLLFPIAISFDWTITRPEGALLLVCYVGFIGWQVVVALAAP